MRPGQVVPTLVALLCVACVGSDPQELAPVDPPFILDLPPGAPPPPIPDDVPFTVAGVELGRALFFDKRLSVDGTISCAACHFPERAFSDTVALSSGVGGALGFRNSPTLANVAYHSSWMRDGGVSTLELQVLTPLHEPSEMASDVTTVADLLKDVEPFRSLSERAYGRALDAYVITRAIASYERTLISGWSRFDRFFYESDASALSVGEMNGWGIFTSAATGCTSCHSGFDLSDHGYQNIGTSMDYADDAGRMRITLQESDRGKFKVPTLRNIALTAPYMHDGGMATLEEVIDHFASGGLPHPNRSPLMHPFTLTPEERGDLIAFLNALTDLRPLDPIP